MTDQQKKDVKRNLANRLMLIENAIECAMDLCGSGMIEVQNIEAVAKIIGTYTKTACQAWQKPT